ncbi:unnamed protein product, partial [Owenia fusiformis]
MHVFTKHMNIFPFQCKVCNTKFIHEDSAIAHCKSVHKYKEADEWITSVELPDISHSIYEMDGVEYIGDATLLNKPFNKPKLKTQNSESKKRVYVCKECKYKSIYKSDVQKHIQLKHLF